ncbi:MAG: pilus assembly protein [Bacilli bacterium]|nr:pilus assembly protein [Bacilli bacterium]
MKNNKGQALIEFVLILPVIILLLFSFLDLGRIILENSKLEGVSNEVISLYQKNSDNDEIESYLASIGYKNINVDITDKGSITTIIITKDVDLMTPGINRIIKDPYSVKVERTINNEE